MSDDIKARLREASETEVGFRLAKFALAHIESLEAQVARLTETLDVQCKTNGTLHAENASLREQVRALRNLVSDMAPHWRSFTKNLMWTAATAGVMASIRQRLDASLPEQPS